MTEDIKAIEEILGFGDIEERLWESAIDYFEEDKTKAVAYFHKLKRVFKIFERECPFILVFANETGQYSLFPESNEYTENNDNHFTVVER